MELKITETNRGKKSLLYEGFSFRVSIQMKKTNDITWRCTVKTCKASVKTDSDCTVVISENNEHNHDSDQRKIERKTVRCAVKRKACEDICARPSKVLRTELQNVQEDTLTTTDLKSLSMAIYRERRKKYPTLPKSRADVHESINNVSTETSKSELFCLSNDAESGIIIFSCVSNLEVLCKIVNEIFIDGTFKCCPKFFEQLYTIHGFKNGHYIPLVYALLPSKSENTYVTFMSILCKLCEDKNLQFKPKLIHVDFEMAMHNTVRRIFPDSTIQCCRFHLGQAWWRKIQKLGLSSEFKDKSSEIGIWLTHFFGIPFLAADDVGDCFVTDMMSFIPDDQRCIAFADYVVDYYLTPESVYPPILWASVPSADAKRTTNGPESFHAHYNEQFYSAHPSIFIFLDVLLKIQITTYIKCRGLGTQATQRRSEKEKVLDLMQKHTKFMAGDIDRRQFIKAIGFKYLP